MLSSRKLITNQKWVSVYKYSTQAKTDYTVSENARPYEDVPGPTKFQLIRGMLPGGMFHGLSMKDLSIKCREMYGNVFKLPGLFGMTSIVMSFNPDHFEKILRTEGVWPFRRPMASFDYYRHTIKKDFYGDLHSLTSSNGEEWGKVRTAVNPILMNPTNVKMYLPKIRNVSKEFVERIREIRDTKTFVVPDDFLSEINRLTFENVVAVALDKELGLIRKNRDNPETLRAFELLHRVFRLMYDLEFKPPYWKIIKTPTFKEMMSTLDGIQEVFEKHVNEAVKSMDMSKKYEDQSVLQKLVNIDKKLATLMVMDMLLAGVDTTSSIFAGLLLCMGTNLDKQEILRKEILNIVPSKDSELTVENMKNMPYLRACIKESIRLYPVGPGSLRRTNQDLEIDGYRIPKGTDFLMNNEIPMKEDKYFPEADKFIPERWLRYDDKSAKVQCPAAKKAQHPFVYLPFGFGPRMCVAKRIVDLELEIALSTILRNYKIEYNYPPEEVFTSYLINTPKVPLRFKFTDIE